MIELTVWLIMFVYDMYWKGYNVLVNVVVCSLCIEGISARIGESFSYVDLRLEYAHGVTRTDRIAISVRTGR